MSSSVMATYKRLPVAFVSGKDSWLVDEDGERYLDALSGISVCNIGHANDSVSRAIKDQADTLLHTSNLYEIPLQEKLARRLCELSGLDQVFFGNSGAEANEAAIKLCRKSGNLRGMKTPKIIVMEGSFHGRTMATLSATANEKVQEGFTPLLEGFVRVPYNDMPALRNIAGSDKEIVAVMLEPVQGEGGVVVPEKDYLNEVRQICDENNWLMVLDEVQTGMCRTGEWFAHMHSDIRPDVMTLAKSLGNGIPIGACIASSDAAKAMSAGSHASTFGGNPLSARAALAVIDYIEENELQSHVKLLGDKITRAFRTELESVQGIVDIRSRGLMIGIELDRECAILVEKALEERLLINITAGHVIRLLPPLIMTEEEAMKMVSIVSALIKDFIEDI